MTKTKKKIDKVQVVTITVVAILILTFIIGFIWGINNVLAMEGTMPPSEVTEGITPEPETKEDVVDFLNKTVDKALSGKPHFDSRTEYEIADDSLVTDGSEQFKSTVLYLREDFQDYLNDNSPINGTADYAQGFDSLLRKPDITADDIEEFKCEYVYYKCASCDEESEEPLDKCDACGSENPYNVLYRDEYTITVTLKNSDDVIKRNFAPRSEKEAVNLLGGETAEVFDVNNLKVDYSTLTITYRVSRMTDELIGLEYRKEMNVEADTSFKGAYEALGTAKTSFTMTEADIYDFVWPSLVLSETKMTVEPKKSDNLLATLTCDDPVKYSVKWSSSDESILTVDEEGYFKAGSKTGEATVTASFEFNGKTYSDSCAVSVRKPVESVKISDKKLELGKGETASLSVKISPKDATVKTVKWYSEDESIAKVDKDGVVTAVSSGTVRVYSLTDDGYYKSTCEVRVK